MAVDTYDIFVNTTSRTDIVDITDRVREKTEKSAIRNGVVSLFVPGSTAALTTIEYESGAVRDLRDAVERIVPKDMHYEHDRRWGDGNGYAHVRAALLGPSLQVPMAEGRLTLGTWQQLVLLDFDNRPRERRILVQMVGE
jgi:secondary thiamine-phosphate synthase enzyme